MTEKEFIRKIAEVAEPLAVKLATMQSTDDVPLGEPINILANFETCIVGSKQDACGCGRKVWLSPSTLAVIDRRGRENVTVWCVVCMGALLAERKGRPQ